MIAQALLFALAAQEVAVRAATLHTMAGPEIRDAVVIVRDGKIAEVGPASKVRIPAGAKVVDAAVVTPGLIDARCTIGVSGLLNTPHDQDQIDRSAPVQADLRAVDAFNPLDPLVAWVRGFGITTVNTGHAPGELVPGQTAVLKTDGRSVDASAVKSPATVAVTLGPAGLRSGEKSPGTRAKAVAMLRQELIRAREYAARRGGAEDKRPSRDLELETMAAVLDRKVPLAITANRAQDISAALRLQKEFGFDLILDSASEAPMLLDDLKSAKVPVIVHPPMYRAWGEYENASFTTAAVLAKAGIPLALQGGYESYVPKARVVLFEAQVAAAHGLGDEGALRAITIDAARILGVADRVGSIEVGKDADLAMFDGNPLEYTTHCTGTLIQGREYPGEGR